MFYSGLVIFITALMPGHNPVRGRGCEKKGRGKKNPVDKIIDICV